MRRVFVIMYLNNHENGNAATRCLLYKNETVLGGIHMIDLEEYEKIGELSNHSKSMKRMTKSLLVGIPAAGTALYIFVFRRYYIDIQLAWYFQLIMAAVIYPLNCAVHEWIHGTVFKLFCPDGTVSHQWGVLGSATSMQGRLTIWQFVIDLLSPMVFLFLSYGLLAVFIPRFFAAFYFTAVIGLASGSNDSLFAWRIISTYRRNDVIEDGDVWCVYRKRSTV